jgi:hypothetical protein
MPSVRRRKRSSAPRVRTMHQPFEGHVKVPDRSPHIHKRRHSIDRGNHMKPTLHSLRIRSTYPLLAWLLILVGCTQSPWGPAAERLDLDKRPVTVRVGQINFTRNCQAILTASEIEYTCPGWSKTVIIPWKSVYSWCTYRGGGGEIINVKVNDVWFTDTASTMIFAARTYAAEKSHQSPGCS